MKLGIDRTATAISAGAFHTCAVLDGGDVRCWGNGVDGRLGYGNEFAIGDYETPDAAGPVQLGGVATAISAGNHTCARLMNGAVSQAGFRGGSEARILSSVKETLRRWRDRRSTPTS